MHVIGRTDKVDFPEFELKNIAVKTDTGAFTSTIHCSHTAEIIVDNQNYLEFKPLDSSFEGFTDSVVRTKDFQKRVVKNSFGTSEERYVITTKIIIFSTEYSIELTLSQRGKMKYPILLGRKFLNKKFTVNTAQKNNSFKQKINQNK